MQAIFHGHSFVEVVSDTTRVLIDPYIDGNPACDLTLDQVLEMDIDAVIVTHGHDDHVGSTVEIAKKTGCLVITSYELGKYFEQEHGLEKVETLGIGGGAQYDGFHVKLFQAWHGGGITSYTHGFTTVAAGVLVSLGERTVYHAGDTGLFSDMKLLEKYNIDVAFLPIGDRYTMGSEDAVIAASFIKASYVVPIHYNTRDKIKADDIEFARQVMLGNHGVPKVLKPGQAVVFAS